MKEHRGQFDPNKFKVIMDKEHLKHNWSIKFPTIGKALIYCDCGLVFESAG